MTSIILWRYQNSRYAIVLISSPNSSDALLESVHVLTSLHLHQGHPNPLDGIQPVVKAALTRAYNKGSKSRVIRTADLISLPGIKKAPKKRVAAMLEPLDEGLAEENGEAIAEDEENSSETEDIGTPLLKLPH